MKRSGTAFCVVAASLGVGLMGLGCSMGRPSAARVTTPANPVETASAPTPAPSRPLRPIESDATARAADLMFQTDEPFALPRSSVNVFGELDGFGPSVFNVGGNGGFQQHTVVEEGYDANPELAPDGKHLLFSSTRHTEHPDIYLQPIDGLAVTQLTTDPADDAFPRFSPDGKRIAFASNRSGNWDIYVMDADGKNVEQVTRATANEIHPTFSPDGTRIAFCSMSSRSGQWELWTLDLTSGRRQMIGYGLFPDWSPRKDRDVIAFQRARQRGTRWFSAWTVELVGDDAKNLTEVAFSSNAAVVSPRWNTDGTRLTFCSIIDPNASDNVASSDQVRGTMQDIWVVNADGSNRQKLTDGKGVNATPTWSRDGRVYFISDRGGSDAIWSVGVGGSTGVAAKPAPTETRTAATDAHEEK